MSGGGIKIFTDLNVIKELLLQEGFYDPGILQCWKEGQVFGLVKSLNDFLEIHVRGYRDDTLEAEVELSREYLEHPHEVRSFYGFLIEILRKHQVPFTTVKPIPPDPNYISIPKNLTRWKPLAFLAAVSISALIAWYIVKDEDHV